MRFQSLKDLTTDEQIEVVKYHGQTGWLAFKADEFQPDDLPAADTDNLAGKSPAQRTRAVLFILWKQTGEVGDFEAFYRAEMEKIILELKKRIDE
jgi:hypothetical protein